MNQPTGSDVHSVHTPINSYRVRIQTNMEALRISLLKDKAYFNKVCNHSEVGAILVFY